MAHDGVNESETTVIIRINDVNDLPPTFLEQSYNTTIFEETIHPRTRKPILQVSLYFPGEVSVHRKHQKSI